MTPHPDPSPPMGGLPQVPDDAISHLASLTAQRDREMLDVSLAQVVLELLGADSVGVYRLLGQDHEPRHWLCCGLARKDQLTISDSPWVDADTLPPEHAFPARSAVLASRALDQFERELALMQEGDHRFVTVLPLMVELGSPGVLEVSSHAQLGLEALRTIQTLLKVFANFQSLLESSQRDALTGLLNRQTFDGSFMRAAQPDAVPVLDAQGRRAVDSASGHWLGVIDIDHFKQVNDGFGHLIGDEVLILLARIMRQSFRHHDRLHRFGGEEFVVLLRGGSEADARSAFERFRHHVASYAFPQVGKVTVSIGYTEVCANDSPNSAFSRADQAVYKAKEQGRNRSLSFEELVCQGELKSVVAPTGGIELF